MSYERHAQSFTRGMRLILLAFAFLSLTLTPLLATAQASAAPPADRAPSAQPQTGSAPQSAAQSSVTPNSDLTQMRTDLDRMESLLGNMSSEIEFLRDQNLQILLRTNAQMWRMLISDLRRQVDREERRAQR